MKKLKTNPDEPSRAKLKVYDPKLRPSGLQSAPRVEDRENIRGGVMSCRSSRRFQSPLVNLQSAVCCFTPVDKSELFAETRGDVFFLFGRSVAPSLHFWGLQTAEVYSTLIDMFLVLKPESFSDSFSICRCCTHALFDDLRDPSTRISSVEP